ncbi:MAG: cell division protein FtsZ [Desulfobacteraceae bacterium]|nr:cell division protein FtsZ [Desulfobacteraceae bacterium]
MMFSYVENGNEKTARIKVIGVGGAGGNAINNMISSNLRGVSFIVANTDIQALGISKAPVKIQIGDKLTEGLGAGANPGTGRDAALESSEAIRNALKDSHMVFITAGFGGGTGTGAAPIIAEICRELGALTVGVVTKPFSFEGKKRARQAEEGIEALRDIADTVITIPNDRLRGLASKNATLLEMFKKADEILLHSVKGITDLIMMPGLVNLDFADVKTTMSKSGLAIMGIGSASGENRATEAAERAISHPLLEDVSISGAKGVLMNITSTSDLTMEEMTEASERIYSEVGDEAEIIWGAVIDDSLGDEMRVTVIATGIGTPESSMAEMPRPRKTFSRGGLENAISRKNFREEKAAKEEAKPLPIEQPRKSNVRDIRPPESKPDYEEPAFMRRKKLSEGIDDEPRHSPDSEDLDIPTFLRRKAD